MLSVSPRIIRRGFNDILEELIDTVDGGVVCYLLADVCRMLVESLTGDRASSLGEATNMRLRHEGTLSKPIERVPREYRSSDTDGTADQGIVWDRSAECWLKRLRELAHL